MKKNKLNISILLFINIGLVFAQTVNVNGIRDFSMNQSTIIKQDGVIIDNTLFEIIGSGGYKIRFKVGTNVNTTISQGTLTEINFISDIKGPITNLSPLTIMDQVIFTTADTVLQNLNSTNILIVGDIVSVSGTISEINNTMQLSRLELNNNIIEWKLRGFARNITPINFTIGSLIINRNAMTASNCGGGFIDNSFVEIKATPDASYSTGSTLTTLIDIECQTPDVNQDPNFIIPVVIEGMVSNIIDLSSFRINDLVVFFFFFTSFDNGEAEHIDEGTKIEIQGFLDTNTRFIDAKTIRFINHRVKFVAPVVPADIAIGQSITIYGKQINITPQTRDPNIIISTGLSEERQIEVRGFIDSAGNIFAERIKDKGTPDNQHVKLRGDITAINQPFLEINGVSIDSSSSIYEIGSGITDINTFFATIQIGMQLKIENAVYDINANTLSMGVIELIEQELEDDPDDINQNKSLPVIKEIIGSGGVGLATVTSITILDLIFNGGFE